MKDAAFGLLMRAIEGDGIIRVRMEQAADPAILSLIEEGYIRPIDTQPGAATEMWYKVDMGSKPLNAKQRAALTEQAPSRKNDAR